MNENFSFFRNKLGRRSVNLIGPSIAGNYVEHDVILLKFYRTKDIHVLLIFTSKVSIFFDLQIAEIQTHGEHLVVFIHIHHMF